MGKLVISDNVTLDGVILIAKVDTLFVPEELDEFPCRRQPSRGVSVRGGTAQPHRLHKSIVMVA